MKEFLRTVSLFSQLTDEEIELLVRTAKERLVPEGSHIVHKGDPGNSAFVLKEGAAEARLEKPPGAPLHLSKIGPGELFGELALFDAEPRSASVVAIQDTIVIEISRDMFLREVAQHPNLALRLLAMVAKRLRRAESIVSDFSERIYGDVMPRLEAAVSAQLNSAKEICEQSKERSESTNKQAEHVLKFGKWVVSIISTLVVVAVTFAGFLGFERFKVFDESIEAYKQEIDQKVQLVMDQSKDELDNTLNEAKQGGGEIKKTLNKLRAELKAFKNDRGNISVLMETSQVFDKWRRDLQLENVTDASRSESSAGSAARDFRVAHYQLKNKYLGQPAKWESGVLVEALDLLAETNGRIYIRLDLDDWDQVINTIEHALKNPPEHWRQRQRLSHLIEKLYNQMTFAGSPAGDLIERMEALLSEGLTEHDAAAVIALTLARIGSKAESVKKVLKQLQTNSRSPWQRAQSGVALVNIGEKQGWEKLRKDVADGWIGSDSVDGEQNRREKAAFATALLLADDVAYAKKDPNRQRHIGLDELNGQLSAESLTPWPEQAPVGVDLISETILKQGTKNPKAWSRFFWRYSCELLCRLDCEISGKADEKTLCTQCFEQFSKEYPSLVEELVRPGDSCAAGDNGAGSSHRMQIRMEYGSPLGVTGTEN